MELVSGDVEGEAAHGRGVAGDGALARPRLVRQRVEEGDGRGADEGVLVEQVGERALVEVRAGDVEVLVEALERVRIAAGDAEGAVDEDALVVDQVADDLFERPLAGGVRRTRSAGRGGQRAPK